MTKLKLCNVHKLALSNEGEQRKPIHIPFGTWAYDDTIDQTLDREHAEAIAADLAGKIAAGEPGIPVYQGHPDVPEYAGKYPDKGALGWVKKILVNEDGMDLEVEWDRDPGKGFGWFSPYWVGDTPTAGANGKRNCIIDGLNSIGLVNNPNIREFRLANEAGEDLTQRRRGAEGAEFKLPEHLVALTKKFDERRAMANVVDANGAGHGADGKFDGSGSGGGGGSGGSSYGKKLVATRQAAVDAAQKTFDKAKSALIAGQKRGWSKEENDKAFKAYDRAERKLKFAKSELRTAIGAPSISHEEQVRRDSKSVFRGTATKAERDRYMSELAKRFDDRAALANVTDANGRDHVDAGSPEGGQFAPGTGTATSAHGKDQLTAKTADGSSWHDANISNRIFHHVPNKWNAHLGLKDDGYKNRDSARHNINAILKQSRDDYHRATIYGRKNSDSKALKGDALEGKRNELRTQQAIHRVAILHGFKYNRATHQYE